MLIVTVANESVNCVPPGIEACIRRNFQKRNTAKLVGRPRSLGVISRSHSVVRHYLVFSVSARFYRSQSVDDDFSPLTLTDTSGNPQRDFIFFNGQRVGMFLFSDQNSYYYLGDVLGSTSVISSGDGTAIKWEADYYPYGGTRVITNNVTNYYQFTGYEKDSDTGYNYAVNRIQSPNLGRFFSPDLIPGIAEDPQSWNRYAYVRNSPLNYTDPLGLMPQCFSFPIAGDNEDDNQTIGYFFFCNYEPNVIYDYPEDEANTARKPQKCLAGAGPLLPGQSRCPANNGPTQQQKQQNCLNSFNNSPDGKFYNFFSLASPLIGPDRLGSTIEDVGGTAAKYGAYKFFQTASRTMAGTPFGSMSGAVADTIHVGAKEVVAPVAAAATVAQVTGHVGCYIASQF